MQHLRDKIRLPIICKLAKQRKRVEQIELQGWCRKLSYTTLTCFLITSVYCQREAKRLVITRICQRKKGTKISLIWVLECIQLKETGDRLLHKCCKLTRLAQLIKHFWNKHLIMSVVFFQQLDGKLKISTKEY